MPEADTALWELRLGRQRWQQHLHDAAMVAGKLAHDFGNALTGILGFSELALTQLPPGTPAHRYVTEVYQAAQQALCLTQQMQTFGQRNPPRLQATALAALVAEEEERIRPSLRPGVTLQASIPGDLPAIAVDAEVVRQLLAPLVQNAQEALSAAGNIRIAARHSELTAEECLDLVGNRRPGPCVELSVTDTGSGLSAEVRDRLFAETFFTTKVRRRGWGLALVYGILRANRGGMRIDPEPRGGTRVRIFLPLAPSPPARGQ
jgi:signal transduction histidine kinase